MAYFLDLFTPETWRTFQQTAQASITGFRERQRHMAEDRVSKGDIFLCYLTRLSRWCGILKPESTEGGRLVSVLKRPKGAPLNLG